MSVHITHPQKNVGRLEDEFNFQTGDVQVNHLKFMGCKRGIVALSTTHIIVSGKTVLFF